MNLFPTAYAEETVEAANQATQQNPDTTFIWMLIAAIALFYFFVLRPQNKKRKEAQQLIEEIKVGDEVITNGGLIGRITKINGDVYTLALSENLEVRVKKAFIYSPVPKGSVEENQVSSKK